LLKAIPLVAIFAVIYSAQVPVGTLLSLCGSNATGHAYLNREELYMEAIVPLVIYFAIWAVVIYGSIYFNRNVR
jgi:hypothetical protein